MRRTVAGIQQVLSVLYCSQVFYTVPFHFILIGTLGNIFLYSHYAEEGIESLMFDKLSRAVLLL